MPPRFSGTRPRSGSRPRPRFLLAALALVLLGFLGSLPWQIRNWQEASALKQDASRQQARVKQLEQMRDDRRRAEKSSSTDPDALLAAAAALAQSGDFPGAAARLRSLEPAAAQSPELSGAAAELYQKLGYIDRAVALARQAARLAPDAPDAWLRLGVLDMQVGRQAQGRALLLRAARALPNSAEPHLALALADNQTGDYKGAEQELAQADRLRPQDWRIAALRADNLGAQRRGADALKVVAEALQLAPQEPALYAKQAGLLLDQARGQASAGRPDIAPAVAAARQCLALDPRDAGAHETLGTAFHAAGEEAEARREWERAYALSPGSRTLAYNLGRLRIAQGDGAGGLALLAESARVGRQQDTYDKLVDQAGLLPNNPELHRQLAHWCQSHQRLSRAIFEWQEVLALRPQDAEARQSAARLLAARG